MQIESMIKEYIAGNILFDPDGFGYPDDASFLREGIIDSMGVMELVRFVQLAFDISVDQAEVIPENFDSVARLAAFIRRKQATKAAQATPA